MGDVVKQFMIFGFSRIEAETYLSILKNPNATGYQLANILSTSKATIYSALSGLYQRGAVQLIEGDSKKYLAKDPGILLGELKSIYMDTADTLASELKDVFIQQETSKYINVEGYTNTIHKTKELILSATDEIYMSCNIDFHLFKEELDAARKRGVRVIIFTFKKNDFSDMSVELYQSNKFTSDDGGAINYILVVDMDIALIANGDNQVSFLGTYSKNPFFVGTMASYIHFDIDIYLLEKEVGHNIIPHKNSIETRFIREFRRQS